ncbi:MAG: helix-turn-helix transcriptional regulator [Pseudomonadota bacterium]
MNRFSDALRTWRKTRRLSQLELAVEAEVSARHISFLETGRAQPSAEMIGRLGEAMQLPLSAQNQLLTQAGFAARYPARDWGDTAMAPIRAAVERMLGRHDPYPALALDRVWRIVSMNASAEALYGALGVHTGDSLLELMLSDALATVIENWPTVAHHTAKRLRTESAAQGGVPELDRAADALASAPAPEAAPASPVVPMVLAVNGARLALFGTIAQFGTPEDVALDDLKIELFFPADETTRLTLEALAS